ncbi:hypothetical protein GCM10023144_16260 [Pigmentiphaga soli]|uniref:Molybdate ABC transporter substrate-binding protein n=1 Tax=Pigmentiphaga soli TaxID=1007095 RepID=A0ABP8GSY9_9BURK
MRELIVLSAGAARGLIEARRAGIGRRFGAALACRYAPVDAVWQALEGGAAADLVVLSRAAFGALRPDVAQRFGAPQTLGWAQTRCVRRADDPLPPLATADALRRALLDSPLLLVPDLERSTGGRHLAAVFRALGVAETLAPRMRHYAGGFEAASALAAQHASGALACAQSTEAAQVPGVADAGMPAEFSLATEYCIGMRSAAEAPCADVVRELLHAARADGGFSPGPSIHS